MLQGNVADPPRAMLSSAAFLCIGFALGILFESGRNYLRERDLLDRLSWRNPSDYFFMVEQRKTAPPPPMLFKFPEMGFLKKKSKPIPTVEKIAQEAERAIENQVNAHEAGLTQAEKYLDHKRQAAKTGAFT